MIQPIIPLPFDVIIEKQDIKKAAKGFEAILWEMVLKEAFKTIPEHSIFRKKGEIGIYRQIMLWSLSNYISENFETDLGKKIYEKFSSKDLSLHPSQTIKINRRRT